MVIELLDSFGDYIKRETLTKELTKASRLQSRFFSSETKVEGETVTLSIRHRAYNHIHVNDL